MIVIDILIYLYLSGVTGFMCRAAILKFPRNLDEFEEILNWSLVWPLIAVHSYLRRVEHKADKLHQESVKALVAELEHRDRIIKALSEQSLRQNVEYQMLLKKYNNLGKKTDFLTDDKESAHSKGKRKNEPP